MKLTSQLVTENTNNQNTEHKNFLSILIAVSLSFPQLASPYRNSYPQRLHNVLSLSQLQLEVPSIVAEFVRLTSVDLKGSLYAGLDQHLERFLEMYKAKTNNVGLRRILENLQDNSSIGRKRAIVLMGLPHFLKDEPAHFIQILEATDDDDKYMKGVKVGFVIVKDGNDIVNAAVVFEEAVVLPSRQSLALCVRFDELLCPFNMVFRTKTSKEHNASCNFNGFVYTECLQDGDCRTDDATDDTL
ncbi:uncharacterized protein V6R79_009919 [Siganus canaliculatus]